MEVSDSIKTLYSAEVVERNGSFCIEIPKREIEFENVIEGRSYQIALLARDTDGQVDRDNSDSTAQSRSKPESGSKLRSRTADDQPQTPPVEEGEVREVAIESMGDQGDGIAKVERGFVVIVPDTNVGQRVRAKIQTVQENVAFAELVAPVDRYSK